MKINLKPLMILLTYSLLSATTYAGWDKQCLDDCFSTHHDCNYCNYQCYREENEPLKPNYSGDTVCPFKNYDK